MDVCGGLVDEQATELQQQDAQSVARSERIVRIDNSLNEDTDDVVVTVEFRRRCSANQRLALAFFEAGGEAGHDDVLEDLGLEFLGPRLVVEDVDELEEGHALPLNAEARRDALLEIVAEELEVRDVTRREAAQDVEEKLDLVHMMPEDRPT